MATQSPSSLHTRTLVHTADIKHTPQYLQVPSRITDVSTLAQRTYAKPIVTTSNAQSRRSCLLHFSATLEVSGCFPGFPGYGEAILAPGVSLSNLVINLVGWYRLIPEHLSDQRTKPRLRFSKDAASSPLSPVLRHILHG